MTKQEKSLTLSEKEVIKKEVSSPQENTYAGKYFIPDTDIFETNKELFVIMDVPGVKKDDVSVRLERNVLHVDARVNCQDYQNIHPIYSEYNVGNYARSFTLSSEVDQSKIEASMEDGVLTLKLPKVPEVEPRKIRVL